MLDRWRLIDSATGDRATGETGAGIISLSVLSAVLSAGWIKINKVVHKYFRGESGS